jgi:flagellar basal body-associated protein FliL
MFFFMDEFSYLFSPQSVNFFARFPALLGRNDNKLSGNPTLLAPVGAPLCQLENNKQNYNHDQKGRYSRHTLTLRVENKKTRNRLTVCAHTAAAVHLPRSEGYPLMP